jgi:hypothetical protein
MKLLIKSEERKNRCENNICRGCVVQRKRAKRTLKRNWINGTLLQRNTDFDEPVSIEISYKLKTLGLRRQLHLLIQFVCITNS